MATFTQAARGLAVACGFVIAVSAAPLMSALDGPAGSGLVLACLDNEILNTANGVCEPSAGGDVSDDYSGNVTGDGDSLEEVDGVPCTGADTGKCIGLQESAG